MVSRRCDVMRRGKGILVGEGDTSGGLLPLVLVLVLVLKVDVPTGTTTGPELGDAGGILCIKGASRLGIMG